MCSQYLGKQKKINSVKHTKFYRFIQKQCSVRNVYIVLAALLLDDTFQPVTPLIDGAVNETLRQFAPLRDDCTLDCRIGL